MIRLNKILRELNISLDLAIKFFDSIEADVEARPTAKIEPILVEALTSFVKYKRSSEGDYLLTKFGLDALINNHLAEMHNGKLDKEAQDEGYDSLIDKLKSIRREAELDAKIEAKRKELNAYYDSLDRSLDWKIKLIKEKLAKESSEIAPESVNVEPLKEINFNKVIERVRAQFDAELKETQEVIAHNLWLENDRKRKRKAQELRSVRKALQSGNTSQINKVIKSILLANGVLVTIEEVGNILKTYGFVGTEVRGHQRRLSAYSWTYVNPYYKNIKRRLK